MKEKLSIIAGIGIICAVIVTLAFYIRNVDNLTIETLLLLIIPIVLIASAMFIVWDRLSNIRKGLPAQDERIKQNGYKASYYGFIASIWSAVGAPLASGILFDHELTGHHTSAAVVLIGGLAFIISYLVLIRRG